MSLSVITSIQPVIMVIGVLESALVVVNQITGKLHLVMMLLVVLVIILKSMPVQTNIIANNLTKLE